MQERELHRRASEVFANAIEMPDSEREAFVGSACGGDADLEKEVRSLLDYHVPDSQAVTENSPPEEPKDMTGVTVGRYRVVSRLGRGGMGVVWQAEDEVLGRPVAMKFLPPAQARSEISRRRFLREARAASSLSHPGIATVFDVGEHEGDPYIAMQLVAGRTVRECLKQQPYAPAEAVRLVLQAARVLEFSHAHGVIHRDVSASNLMVTNEGTIVVLDFGVALRSVDTTRLSRTGELVGTLGYMAPEIIQGEDASAQSDVFSLGVVLYQMLTGYMPFQSKKPARVVKQSDAVLEPVGRLLAAIPRELDSAIARALARDRAVRYATAQEFADDLEAVLNAGVLSDEPVKASRPPRPYAPKRPSERIRHMMSRVRRTPRPPSSGDRTSSSSSGGDRTPRGTSGGDVEPNR
ncbi:MAG TPA: serine/threonine-protein kinase [Candidatus Krumholzibacteria bacterium]|nr:serine/threonine-protein kinase [Candidatus Krumholzibacteria bacterium]